IVDLKCFSGGVKAWNERHKAKCYKCGYCGQVLYPEEYLSLGGKNRMGRSRSGENLDVWCVYNKIALSLSLRQIVAGIQDVFGLSCHNTTVANALRKAAQKYQSTYLELIDELRSSVVIHADETWVSLATGSRRRGYIWTFANMENAVYKFSLTREADTPTEMLQDFSGVLVSDFYRAYDSLECTQQKCLVHLVRNMNDDIFKNPLDAELKTMVAAFGVLLRSIVETIDRYGLKKRHLNKHRKNVDRFYREELEREFASETAKRYQKRMRRYRERLFVFLEHDGVPWNNNNAENAIKTFVVRRKFAGAFSVSRIDEYLILLSILQTLRYRDASFFEFLRSGETDIDKFCHTRR
ncbi:MAG: IS66 family transposase, partial [Planctomycetes bacterium]|nr:IS66 family transposase [Planctomycetota bacterium]